MAYYNGEDLATLSEEDWKNVALAQFREKQKPLWQLRGLVKVIHDIDPDILMLVEVGGQESLDHFNEHFLNHAYTAYFVSGNARRGIDLAFLVKKECGFKAEARSNRDLLVEVNSWHGKQLSRFSRDIAELRLIDEQDQLKMILLLTHLKSKLGSEHDARGKDVRTAEAFALSEFYERLRVEYPNTPMVVGGDLNSELSSLELERLRHTDLTDFHDLIETPRERRISYVHVAGASYSNPMVLDYLLVSPHLNDRVVVDGSYTYRYTGFYGEEEVLPETRHQRKQMPSDHYPIVLTLKMI